MIAQTTIGTKMMRPNVMRFGILKRVPPAPGALTRELRILASRVVLAPTI